jgi:hypothetical protein
MKIEEFDNLVNFKSTERGLDGKPLEETENIAKINKTFMQVVDDYVSYCKVMFKQRKPTCVIHCITSGDSHVPGSAHGAGLAVDCHVTGLSLFEMYMIAMTFPFMGVGFYPYQNNPFVHLDAKDRGRKNKAIWFRNENGIYVYETDKILGKLKEL